MGEEFDDDKSTYDQNKTKKHDSASNYEPYRPCLKRANSMSEKQVFENDDHSVECEQMHPIAKTSPGSLSDDMPSKHMDHAMTGIQF